MKISFVPAAPNTGLPIAAHFLEHASQVDARQIIVGDGDGRIHLSQDFGTTFFELARFEASVSKCFTLRNGQRLVRLKGLPRTFKCDASFNVVATSSVTSHEWHGSWSIDESFSGVVMFCEYVDRSDIVRVWRSVDGGEDWVPTLVATSLTGVTPVAQVRHFHTCSWIGGLRWIVSSGDESKHCRVWQSGDEGLTWDEIRDWTVSGADVAEAHSSSILRHTAEVWDGDGVAYWVTDDLLHRGRSAFVRASIPHRTLEVLADLGGNEMRTLVRHGDCFVAISEVKHDLRHVDVYVLSREGRIMHEEKIGNPRGQKLAFTRSRSSKATVNGTFFTFDDGLLSERCRFVRWHIDE